MKTQVSIHHHDYPSGMRHLVEEKLGELLRFCNAITSMEAHLEKQASVHRVEIIANVPHGPVLVADGRADGVRGALDEALSRMARKLKRSREKQTTERRRAMRHPEA
ncbi:MAG: ribosomal subunit interface protein [Candidatus Paceibacteria bacterium]|jgi:ribosomal subunit interface protein